MYTTNQTSTMETAVLTKGIVIFGATGDLCKRKLIPSLHKLWEKGLLPENFVITGSARRDPGVSSWKKTLGEYPDEFMNQAEALKLENNYITDLIKVSETINTDPVMSVNKDAANKYLRDQNNILLPKYKSLATNNNVAIKFENYALSETQKTIFRTDTQISKNILTNLFSGYEKQKELLLITADTDQSGIAKGTLRTDLEKLTIDTFQSQVSAPELKVMLKNIPVELQTYDGLKDVQQAPRKTFYALKDKNYLPDISFEQRLKLKKKLY